MSLNSNEVETTDTLGPPRNSFHAPTWVRKNFFDSWFNTSMTLISLGILYLLVPPFFTWAFTEAKWAVIPANLKVLMSGTYPAEQLWRVWLVLGIVLFVTGIAGGVWQGILLQYMIGMGGILGILALLPLGTANPLTIGPLTLGQPQLLLAAVSAATFVGIGLGWKRFQLKSWTLMVWTGVLPIAFLILLRAWGDQPGVSTKELSGLLLTLIFSIGALIIGFPIGILLALGRTNQDLPVIKVFCTLVIELVRSIPLTTILFAAWLLVPLMLRGLSINLFIRAEIGFILFTASYIAEDVRGGLQSIPRGQWEAARALGLNPYQVTTLVILPQALRVAIPAIVNEFLTLFKDTSLVVVIGAIEFLDAGTTVYNSPNWLGTQKEVLFFVGLVYFCFCYAMAVAATRLEKQLGLGVH